MLTRFPHSPKKKKEKKKKLWTAVMMFSYESLWRKSAWCTSSQMELCALSKKASKFSSVKAANSWARTAGLSAQQATNLLLLLLLPLLQLAYLERSIVLFTCTSKTGANGKLARTAEEHITDCSGTCEDGNAPPEEKIDRTCWKEIMARRRREAKTNCARALETQP